MSRARRKTYCVGRPSVLASETEGIFLEQMVAIDRLGEVASRATIEAVEADAIGELRRQRRHARQAAQARLQQQHERIVEGLFDDVAPDVDPLGSARRYTQEIDTTRKQHLQGMVLIDARTTLYEAASKNGAELFPLGSLQWDGDDFIGSDERSITDVTWHGLSAVSSLEQQAIRVSEHVEAITPAELVRQGLHHGTGIITVYPPNETQNQTMVRYSWFEEEDDNLMLRTQQLSLAGDSCDLELIQTFFRTLGAEEDIARPGAAAQKQLLVDHAQVGGVATVGRYLDDVAGRPLITGMEPMNGFDPYEQLEVESRLRHELLEESAEKLAAYCIELAQQKADPFWSAYHVKRYVERLLHEVSRQVPEIASRAFDGDTAKTYQLARSVTDKKTRQRLFDYAQLYAPEISYCGAGSCGLVEASPQQALLGAQLGLRGGEFVYFADGNCRECGTKGVIYDMEGNAACQDCKKSSRNTDRNAK